MFGVGQGLRQFIIRRGRQTIFLDQINHFRQPPQAIIMAKTPVPPDAVAHANQILATTGRAEGINLPTSIGVGSPRYRNLLRPPVSPPCSSQCWAQIMDGSPIHPSRFRWLGGRMVSGNGQSHSTPLQIFEEALCCTATEAPDAWAGVRGTTCRAAVASAVVQRRSRRTISTIESRPLKLKLGIY
jgi:hypothetical protein